MNKLLKDLNRQQRLAVEYEEGPLLVLAGAGSGKTKVLTHRAAWLIGENKASAENVLLLTFTNKAAGEMTRRIISLINKRPAFSGTFHSFCVRLLRTDGRAIGVPINFLIYDDEDQKDAIKEILTDLDLPIDSYNPAFIASQISEAKTNMLTPLAYAEIIHGEYQERVFKIYNEYEKYLKKVGALDFDDLLLRAVELLKTTPAILTKWQKS